MSFDECFLANCLKVLVRTPTLRMVGNGKMLHPHTLTCGMSCRFLRLGGVTTIAYDWHHMNQDHSVYDAFGRQHPTAACGRGKCDPSSWLGELCVSCNCQCALFQPFECIAFNALDYASSWLTLSDDQFMPSSTASNWDDLSRCASSLCGCCDVVCVYLENAQKTVVV